MNTLEDQVAAFIRAVERARSIRIGMTMSELDWWARSFRDAMDRDAEPHDLIERIRGLKNDLSQRGVVIDAQEWLK